MAVTAPTIDVEVVQAGDQLVKVSVLVPLHGADREHLWAWLRKRWAETFPEFEIVLGRGRDEHGWSKGAALHAAAKRANGYMFILADADTWIDPLVIEEAVVEVLDGAPWVMPHSHVHRLSARVTRLVLSGQLNLGDAVGKAVRAPVGGGCSIMLRETWDKVGGVDPRFYGWGGEDIAFGWALDTLAGPHLNLGAPLYHLWHPLAADRRRASPDTDRLAGRYSEARGRPEAMRALIGGAPDDLRWREMIS